MYDIFFDLEKTLLNDQKQLLDQTKNDLKELSKIATITILTSAAISSFLPFFKNINVRIVSETENAIWENGIIKTKLLDICYLNQILNDYRESIYTAYTIHQQTTNVYQYKERLKSIYPTKYIAVTDHFKENSSMFFIALKKEFKAEIIEKFQLKNYNALIIGEDRNRVILLITNGLSTKEHWLHKLKKSPAIGIGDSFKDFSFIKNCDIKIAMKNGENALKNLCDYETDQDNNHSGATRFILNLLKHQTF